MADRKMDPRNSSINDSSHEFVGNHREEENERRSEVDLSNKKFHEKLDFYLHRPIVEYIIIFFIVVDALLVVAALLIGLKIIRAPPEGGHNAETVTETHDQLVTNEAKMEHIAESLHYTSLAILTLFLLEIFLKLYAQREKFFKRKIQIIDSFVVVLSFAFDVVVIIIKEIDSTIITSLGLIVILRLWRLVRIVNGAVVATKMELEERIHEHKREASEAKEESEELKARLEEKEAEIEFLKSRLSKYEHIEHIPSGSTRLPAYLPETRGFPKSLLGGEVTDDEDYSISGFTDPAKVRLTEVSKRAALDAKLTSTPAPRPNVTHAVGTAAPGGRGTAFVAYQPGAMYHPTSSVNQIDTKPPPSNHPHNPRAEMYVDNLDIDTADESDVMSLPPKARTGNTFTVKKDGVPMTSL